VEGKNSHKGPKSRSQLQGKAQMTREKGEVVRLTGRGGKGILRPDSTAGGREGERGSVRGRERGEGGEEEGRRGRGGGR